MIKFITCRTMCDILKGQWVHCEIVALHSSMLKRCVGKSRSDIWEG